MSRYWVSWYEKPLDERLALHTLVSEALKNCGVTRDATDVAARLIECLKREEWTVKRDYNSYGMPTWPAGVTEIGKWNTGTRMSDNAATFCALVDTNDEQDILAALAGRELRFCNQKTDDYAPGDRLAAFAKAHGLDE